MASTARCGIIFSVLLVFGENETEKELKGLNLSTISFTVSLMFSMRQGTAYALWSLW